MPNPAATVVLPLRVPAAQLSPMHSVRGTLLLSSLHILQERGLRERHDRLLSSEALTALNSLVAGSWVPVALSDAHFTACDRLGLSRAEQLELGRATGQKQDQTIFRWLVNLAKQSGATPWMPLSMLGKIQDRVILGGGVAVYKLGPKDALIECHLMPFAQLPYVHQGYCGMFQNTCEYFCRKAYLKVNEVTPSKVSWLASWA